MVTIRRSIWHEPRPDDAPPVGRLDWLLVGVFAAAALIEGIARPGLAWRPVVTVLALELIPALLWRRDRPLTAALVGWGVAGLLSVLQLSAHAGDLGVYSMMAVLICDHHQPARQAGDLPCVHRCRHRQASPGVRA